jgi:hypothetical protein
MSQTEAPRLSIIVHRHREPPSVFYHVVLRPLQAFDISRTGDPRIVELADAGLGSINEPFGEGSISSNFAHCY